MPRSRTRPEPPGSPTADPALAVATNGRSPSAALEVDVVLQLRISRRTGRVRYYGDFRRYADVGGAVEALRPPGSRHATDDPAVAAALWRARARVYAARQARAALATTTGSVRMATAARADRSRHQTTRLFAMVALHLERKATAHAGKRASTVRRDREALAHVQAHFGDCRLVEITPARLERYVAWRAQTPGLRCGTRVAPATIRNELHALSNLFRRALALGYVSQNPVALMMEKPQARSEEASFLTGGEAGRLLDAAAALDAEVVQARRVAAAGRRRAANTTGLSSSDEPGGGATLADLPCGAPARDPSSAGLPQRRFAWVEVVLALLLYTGGRIAEVLGLLVEDIDLHQRRVHFRPNVHRRLKRNRHCRTVELWPDLDAILRRYLAETGLQRGLLLPGRTGRMMPGFARQLERAVQRAGLDGTAGRRITPHTLRHTFATMLLQTLVPTVDGGWAVRSSFDVARRLGHQKSTLVDSLYGHVVPQPRYARELSYAPYRRATTTPRA